MTVQLVYFAACPNVGATRDVLRRALEASGLPAAFDEIDVDAPGTPDRLRDLGSPTILVDGIDLFGNGTTVGCACRIYTDAESPSVGVPSERAITDALKARQRRPHWIRSALHLPGAVLPLLPAATCPFCIAAYAGVMSSIGLGFLVNERVLVPLILVFLAVNIVTVAWSTRSHRQSGPLVATLAGAVGVLVGRVVWLISPIVYAGVLVLVVGSLWNLWLKRARPAPLVRLGSTRSRTT